MMTSELPETLTIAVSPHCTKHCWFAKGTKCRCSCGGENHGAMNPQSKMERKPGQETGHRDSQLAILLEGP